MTLRTAPDSVGSLPSMRATPGITSPVVTNFASQISCKRSNRTPMHLDLSSASPKPHPSKPHPCNMPRSCAAVFGMLRCRSCTATFAFLQCGSHSALQQAKNCTATSKKLRCRKVALSCRFPADFKLPRLPKGPSRTKSTTGSKLTTGSKFATAIAKHYGGHFETTIHKRQRSSKSLQIVKKYGNSKTLRN